VGHGRRGSRPTASVGLVDLLAAGLARPMPIGGSGSGPKPAVGLAWRSPETCS
jgi:hypothetical protein